MRILVTGGAGFIGQRVVSTLTAAGHDIVILDALLPGAHPADAQPPAQDAEFIHGNLADADVARNALAGVDVVCHQAAMVGRGREILDAPLYTRSNDLGTATLLAAMTEAGIRRIVHASSVVIYGDSRYQCPQHSQVRSPRRSRADLEAGRFEPRCPTCDAELSASAVEEDDLLDPPRNVYAVTKLAQEHLVGAWARETEGSAVALRYHNVYGPGMPFDSPYSGVAATFRTFINRGEAPRVYEDGGPMRDFVHVTDVATANLAALNWGGVGFRAFNIASGTPRSILQLARVLSAAADGPAPLITGEYRIGDVRHIFASSARAIAELGWRPVIDFESGVNEFATAPMRMN